MSAGSGLLGYLQVLLASGITTADESFLEALEPSMQPRGHPLSWTSDLTAPVAAARKSAWRFSGLSNYLESQWLIIMGYFKPIMAYFGVWWPIISSYLAVQVVLNVLRALVT